MGPNRPTNDGDDDNAADHTTPLPQEGISALEERSLDRTSLAHHLTGTETLLRWASTLPEEELIDANNIYDDRNQAFGGRGYGLGSEYLRANRPQYEAPARAAQEETRSSIFGNSTSNSSNLEYGQTTGSLGQIQQRYGNQVRPTAEEYRAARSRTFGDHAATSANRNYGPGSERLQSNRQQYEYHDPARATREESRAAGSLFGDSSTPFSYNYISIYSDKIRECYGTPARTIGGMSRIARNNPRGPSTTPEDREYGQNKQQGYSDPAHDTEQGSRTARVLPRGRAPRPAIREHDLGARYVGQSWTPFRPPERTAQEGCFNSSSPGSRRISGLLSSASEYTTREPSAIVSSIDTRSTMSPRDSTPRPFPQPDSRSTRHQSRGRKRTAQYLNTLANPIGTQRLMPSRDPMVAFYATPGPKRRPLRPRSSIGRHAPPDDESAKRAEGRVKRAESRPTISEENVAARRDVVPQHESVLADWKSRDAILQETWRRRSYRRQGMMAPPPPPSVWTRGSNTQKQKERKEMGKRKKELKRKTRKEGRRVKKESLVRKPPRSPYPGRQSEFVTRAIRRSLEEHMTLSGRLYGTRADESSADESSRDESSLEEMSSDNSSDSSSPQPKPTRHRATASLSEQNVGHDDRSFSMGLQPVGPRWGRMAFSNESDQHPLQEQRDDRGNTSGRPRSERCQSSTDRYRQPDQETDRNSVDEDMSSRAPPS